MWRNHLSITSSCGRNFTIELCEKSKKSTQNLVEKCTKSVLIILEYKITYTLKFHKLLILFILTIINITNITTIHITIRRVIILVSRSCGLKIF